MDINRFWSRVDKDGDSGCWLWKGATNSAGYGHLYLDGAYTLAHRLSYTSVIGPVTIGKELDHLCRTPRCVNPLHLEPVTHQENVRRGINGQPHETCRKGHSYVGNTYTSGGKRRCRICARANVNEHRRLYGRNGAKSQQIAAT